VTSLRFELTAPAERDLEEIFFEVKERHGLLVAEGVYGNLLRTFELLADMPEMGRHRPELWPPPYRFWPTGPVPEGVLVNPREIGDTCQPIEFIVEVEAALGRIQVVHHPVEVGPRIYGAGGARRAVVRVAEVHERPGGAGHVQLL
jgi:plasmid stabilization system protein ParE